MIEKFEDLGLDKIYEEDFEGPKQPISYEDQVKIWLSEIENCIKEKLGINFDMLKKSLSEYTISHAEELTHEFVNISPFGDYEKLLEDNDSMAEFLKTEAHKPEHWRPVGITPSTYKTDLISFHFSNKAVDDGDVFDGFVYVSFQGKIKHAFTQGNDN